MKLREMARKAYRIFWKSFSPIIFVSIIMVSIGGVIDIIPDSVFLMLVLLFVVSIIVFIIGIVRFMTIPKRWKKEFLKTHPESATLTFVDCDIIELDGIKPSIVDLKEKHTSIRSVFNPTTPPYFRGWIDTDIPFRGFLDNDGLALPFTLGARNRVPVHYMAEGEHKALLSKGFAGNKGIEMELSFEAFRGNKYEIFYDYVNERFDIKDVSQEKGFFKSFI